MHHHPPPANSHRPSHGGGPPETGATAVDPVCGMTVNPESARGQTTHDGQTYYFCSTHCLDKFRADPGRYTTPVATKAANEQTYTCPMHPEVRQAGPGACPKCGMALEPVGGPVPAAATEYVCPMHPEVVSDAVRVRARSAAWRSSRCVATAARTPNPELVDMTRRFWVGTALALPLFVMAMAT